MSKIWTIILNDFDYVVVFADGDKAGIDSARRIQEDLGRKAVIARCDEGEDVASMVAAGRQDVLRARAGLT